MTISGPGADHLTIRGSNGSRVLRISGYSTVADISGLTITEGYADYGGGIYLENATLNLTDSAISTNFASTGGGIYAVSGTLNLTRSTVSGNTAVPTGGGILLNSGTLNLTNCTVAYNWARGGFSPGTHIPMPGILGGVAVLHGTLTLTNSTVFGNSAGGGPGVYTSSDTNVVLKNTLLALNIRDDGQIPQNCAISSSPVSLGYNLSDDESCSFSGTGDMNGTSAGLDPNGLLDNGGPTKTVALLPDSQAVDAVPIANCTDVNGNPVLTDQRGAPRPLGNGCDIGAFEFSIPVIIDIDPGADLNSINLKSAGTTPAAICSSPDFDPRNVDPQSIELAGASIARKGKAQTPMASYEYLSAGACAADNTYPDLLVHFNTKDLALSRNAVSAFLTGRTAAQPPKGILGGDSVRIVPPGK